jgi:oligopeptide/dipeptide ABC transporter ATP-binding protein
MGPRELRRIRGKEIAMMFQDPNAALDPVIPAGEQVAEAARAHGTSRRRAKDLAVELLESVGIPLPRERARAYPHQLSGGMKQRVLLAAALAAGPRLLIADEPTTALDATIEAQVIGLLRSIRARTGMAILLITHDLGVVAELADRVAVMYAGRIVEEAPVGDLFDEPLHPYTRALFDSLPRGHDPGESLRAIPGDVPDPAAYPAGCRFHPRCTLAIPECRAGDPALVAAGTGRRCACIRVGEGALPLRGVP